MLALREQAAREKMQAADSVASESVQGGPTDVEEAGPEGDTRIVGGGDFLIWMSGRAADCSCFENSRSARNRGFESFLIRLRV